MKKNVLTLTLAFAMLLGMLAGCGAKEADVSDQTAASSVSSAAPEMVPDAAEIAVPQPEILSSAEETPDSDQAVPEAEFDIYGPFADETITLTYWKLWPPFLEGYDPKEASLFATFRERLNVEVEVTTIGTDSADTKFNLMVASGDYLDIIENAANNYAGGGTKAIQDEVLLDLMPYMEVYAPDYWATLQTDEVAMKTMVDADNQMASIVSLYDEMPRPQMGLWIRSDWLEAQNMQMPSSLEELEAVLDMFKNTYGCTDAYACRENCDVPIRNVYQAFEWSVDEDNQVHYGYTDAQDNFKDYLKKAHEWYEKGYFSSGFITANDTTLPKSSMIVNGQSGLFDADIMIVSEVGTLDDTIEISALAPITKNADDKVPADWMSRMNNSNMASISTKCENPEYAVAFINYAFTEDAFMAVNWGTEGETYTLENGKPVFTDLMLNNPNLPASFTPLAYISPGFPFLKSYEMALSSYTYPAQAACFDIYVSKTDDSLPKTGYPKDFVTFTTAESETLAQYQSDLETYVTECLAKFFTGDMDVDTDYDAFAAQIRNLGSEEVKQVYQSAYERFVGIA